MTTTINYREPEFKKYHTIKKKHNFLLSEYYIVKKYKQFYKNLSDNEKKALLYYKNKGYIYMNEFLYDDKINDRLHNYKELFSKEAIKNLLRDNSKNLANSIIIKQGKTNKYIEFIINKYIINPINTINNIFTNKYIDKLTSSDILYRGIEKCHIDKNKIGDEIIFKNLMSTSKNKDVSINVCLNTNKSCLFVLSNMKELPYIYLSWNMDVMKSEVNFTEYEYLLPSNLIFRLVKIEEELLPEFKKTIKTFKNLNKITNKSRYKKIYKKINVYYLEFIKVLEFKPLPRWTLSQNYELQIYPNKFYNDNIFIL